MSKKKQRKGVSPINYSDIPDLVTVEWFAKLMSIDKRTEQWSNFLKYGSSIVPMASDSMVQMSEIPHDTKSARKSFRKSFAKSVDYRDVKTISKCIGLNVTETRELLDGIDDVVFCQLAHKDMHDDFGVACGHEDGAIVFQLAAQFQGIDQIAVVGNGNILVLVVDKERLGIDYGRPPCCRIAHMSKGNGAGELLQMLFGKDIGHKAHALVLMTVSVLVKADNAGTLLPPVLLGIETKVGETRGVRMSVDGKQAAAVMNHVALLPRTLLS